MGRPPPLLCPQLTRLQLRRCTLGMTDIGVMVSQLPQLEVLEVLDSMKPTAELRDAHTLSKLPRLRVVNLSDSLLWVREGQNVMKQLNHMPEHVAEQLLALRKTAPHIDWCWSATRG